jgi:UDP-N-acetylglucosamine 2-epimerase (non-hydrolysing)
MAASVPENVAEAISEKYGVVTLHRPSNVDERETLEPILDALIEISEELPLVFTLHPRTNAMIKKNALNDYLNAPNIHAVPPMSYFEMLGANMNATVVITDSGGLQEETTALGVPCLTVRENTERPITITSGTSLNPGAI